MNSWKCIGEKDYVYINPETFENGVFFFLITLHNEMSENVKFALLHSGINVSIFAISVTLLNTRYRFP